MVRLSKEKKPESASRPRAQAPGHVREVLHSPGQPLDARLRSFFEPRFHHDFSKVRVHSDEKSAESAEAINASAYTVGRHLVFAGGAYAPETEYGQQLLAHELAHVVQQGGTAPVSDLELGASNHSSEREAASAVRITHAGFHLEIASRESKPVVRRAGPDDDKWNPAYRSRLSALDKPYKEFKGGLGDIRATTKGGLSENVGRPIPERQGAGTPAREITMPTLMKIYPGLAADISTDPAKAEKAQLYLNKLNEAFKIMKIDTAEAQALYLAHAFVESDQFRQFVETQGAVDKGAQKWMDDPTKARLDTSDLGTRYPVGKNVNPMGKFEFIGRGPVQVTHRGEYVETIAMLEKTAAQYKADGDEKSAAVAREAAREIKIDPNQAANPKYSFLFSAAFMKKFGADVGAAGVDPNEKWTGKDTASGFVAGGKLDAASREALGKKQEQFKIIRQALIDETKKPKAATP